MVFDVSDLSKHVGCEFFNNCVDCVYCAFESGYDVHSWDMKRYGYFVSCLYKRKKLYIEKWGDSIIRLDRDLAQRRFYKISPSNFLLDKRMDSRCGVYIEIFDKDGDNFGYIDKYEFGGNQTFIKFLKSDWLGVLNKGFYVLLSKSGYNRFKVSLTYYFSVEVDVARKFEISDTIRVYFGTDLWNSWEKDEREDWFSFYCLSILGYCYSYLFWEGSKKHYQKNFDLKDYLNSEGIFDGLEVKELLEKDNEEFFDFIKGIAVCLKLVI